MRADSERHRCRPCYLPFTFIFAAMFSKAILSFVACLLLAGSSILPLGDFALMRDIPAMYGNYEKATTSEELGVIDFIGDYLLHGKDIFGHNKNDKRPDGNNGVQFQHQADPLSVAFFTGQIVAPFSSFEDLHDHPPFFQQFLASGHKNGLFRPPLS